MRASPVVINQSPTSPKAREKWVPAEPGFKFWQDFDYAVGIMLGAETFGNFAGVFVGTANKSDGARREHRSTLKQSTTA
jgi:hypothetical protein